jgi:hypothetical protein
LSCPQANLFPSATVREVAASPEYEAALEDLYKAASSSDLFMSSESVSSSKKNHKHHPSDHQHAYAGLTPQTEPPAPNTTTGLPISQYGDTFCAQQDIVLPTSTEDVAAAVQYYYSLMGPYSRSSSQRPSVKIRVASRIRGIDMPDKYRYELFQQQKQVA